jgi:pimeloyl-ACP methyl ester carboxylesterase
MASFSQLLPRSFVWRVVVSSLALVACGDSGSDQDEDASAVGEKTSGKTHPAFTSVAVDPLTAPPVTNDCISDVSAGDHTFSCDGLTYLVLVDPQCTKKACGLIFDVHGATMSGLQERDNTLLNETAPKAGFVYVNPSATPNKSGGTWNLTRDPPKLAVVMDKVISAFHINPKRVHVTGFSQGGATTFWFLENKNAVLASAAPVAGALEQPAWATAAWQPRVPTLVMNGLTDAASTIDNSNLLVDTMVKGLELTGGAEIEGDGHYSRKHWTGAGGMVLDYITHDYGGQLLLAGHCIPGGIDLVGSENNLGAINQTTCTTGDIKLSWGDVALQWFIDHPKP